MTILRQKNALITGGSSGIGQAIAIAFAKAGANVAFTFHQNTSGADDTLRLMGNEVEKIALKTTMANQDAVRQLSMEAINRLGHIDILVNNAGMITRHPHFFDITFASFEEVMFVNLHAAFLLTQSIAKQMREQQIKGSIIHISSISAELTSSGAVHYECSKSGMNALTRGAAADLAQYGIRVNGIAPGLVTTNINKEQRQQNPEIWQHRTSKVPLGRVGTPEEIARIALLLASDETSWMTGSTITIDGGSSVLSPFT